MEHRCVRAVMLDITWWDRSVWRISVHARMVLQRLVLAVHTQDYRGLDTEVLGVCGWVLSEWQHMRGEDMHM